MFKNLIFAALSVLLAYYVFVNQEKNAYFGQNSKASTKEDSTTKKTSSQLPAANSALPATNAMQAASTKNSSDSLSLLSLPKKPDLEQKMYFVTPREKEIMAKIQLHSNAGDYQTALKTLVEFMDDPTEPKSEEFHRFYGDALPTLLLNAAYAFLKLSRCDEAIPLFREADELDKNLDSTRGLAFCYYQYKSFNLAEEEINWYLERKRKDLAILNIYSEILESTGRLDEALVVLQEMLPLAKDNPEMYAAILKKIEAMKNKAIEGQKQNTFSQGYFSITYRTDFQSLAEQVMGMLDRGLADLCNGIGFAEPKSLIEVILYPQENFMSMTPGAPTWVEGLFDGRLRIPITSLWIQGYNLDHLEKTIRHELTHALFSQMTGARRLPPWWDEGMAQRASCPLQGCGTFLFPQTSMAFLQKIGFTTPFTSYDATKAEQAYIESLYLVRYLEANFGLEGLKSMVESIRIDSKLDSDSLLTPLGLNFATLIQNAGASWQNRTSP